MTWPVLHAELQRGAAPIHSMPGACEVQQTVHTALWRPDWESYHLLASRAGVTCCVSCCVTCCVTCISLRLAA